MAALPLPTFPPPPTQLRRHRRRHRRHHRRRRGRREGRREGRAEAVAAAALPRRLSRRAGRERRVRGGARRSARSSPSCPRRSALRPGRTDPPLAPSHPLRPGRRRRRRRGAARQRKEQVSAAGPPRARRVGRRGGAGLRVPFPQPGLGPGPGPGAPGLRSAAAGKGRAPAQLGTRPGVHGGLPVERGRGGVNAQRRHPAVCPGCRSVSRWSCWSPLPVYSDIPCSWGFFGWILVLFGFLFFFLPLQ